MIIRNANNLSSVVLWNVLLTPSSRPWEIIMLYLLDFLVWNWISKNPYLIFNNVLGECSQGI